MPFRPGQGRTRWCHTDPLRTRTRTLRQHTRHATHSMLQPQRAPRASVGSLAPTAGENCVVSHGGPVPIRATGFAAAATPVVSARVPSGGGEGHSARLSPVKAPAKAVAQTWWLCHPPATCLCHPPAPWQHSQAPAGAKAWQMAARCARRNEPPREGVQEGGGGDGGGCGGGVPGGGGAEFEEQRKGYLERVRR